MSLKYFILACLSLLLLNGCAAPYSSRPIPQDTIGTYFADKFIIEKKLFGAGVEIVELGDKVSVLIPTDRVFEFNSPTIRPDSHAFLDMLTAYISRFCGTHLTIAVYTDNVGSKHKAKIMSQYRAQSVAAYFWVRGFPQQNLHPIGRGMEPTIADNDNVHNNRLNRRIEICFWKSLAY
ncbi:N/A [soil metagenome]